MCIIIIIIIIIVIVIIIAGEPYVSQFTILYNSGKKPKFV